MPLRGREFAVLSCVGFSLIGSGSAWAAPPISISGGTYELGAPDAVVVWPNSPTVSLVIDNSNSRSFANWRVRWNNCLAGSFVSTPEGVVIGTSLDGRAIEGTATLQPAEQQRWSMRPNLGTRYQFAVVGNLPAGTGQARHLRQLSGAMSQAKAQFTLHLGDAHQASAPNEYRIFRDTLAGLSLPTYCVPSFRATDQKEAWQTLFGEREHTFRLNADAFVVLDNTAGTLSPAQEAWLFNTLESLRKDQVRHIFIFGYLPLVDVRPGLNQGMQNRAQVRRLLKAFSRYKVNTVFGGKLGLFATETRYGVRYVTTGGGGDYLVAPPAKGGFHHWVKVSVEGDSRVVVTPERIKFAPIIKK